ncbi:MAG: protein kinase [Planctomycetes bacterium]|nr:protein kinase [Planctomycetota bacterium]
MGNEIVVVEVDEAARDLVTRLLAGRGHAVEAFASLGQARSHLEGAPPPALVVIGLDPPAEEGLELIAAIQSIYGPRTPPVLVLSGLTSEADILRSYAAGADDYLSKPPKPPELQAKVAVLMARNPGSAETQLDPELPRKNGLDFGRYERQRVIGKGSSGTVYEARDTVEHRPVALKVLSALKSQRAEHRYRFLREAYAVTAVEHPSVVRVYDFGVEEGRLYYSMELLSGPTLAARVAEGPLSVEETLELMIPIAEALAALQQSDLVHRDVKPTNVVLRDGAPGQPVLIDFGLSKLSFDRSLTGPGVVLGTAAYLAPEVVSGAEHDQRSDLYALGMLARFALTGEDLWSNVDPCTVLRRQLSLEIPLPELPASFQAVLRKLLAPDPQARYQRGEDLAADLRALQAESVSRSPKGA